MMICIPCHANTGCPTGVAIGVDMDDSKLPVNECRVCHKFLPCLKCDLTGNEPDTFAEWLYEWALPLTPAYFVARDYAGKFICAGDDKDDVLAEALALQQMYGQPTVDIEVSQWKMQWRELSQIDRDLWETRAAHVREAALRGGFKRDVQRR